MMRGEEKTPDERAVANDIAAVLIDHYGFLPLDVRYAASDQAIEVVRCWRSSDPDLRTVRLTCDCR